MWPLPVRQIAYFEPDVRAAASARRRCARYGHMLELYEPTETLTGFYAMVRATVGDFSKGVVVGIAFD